MVRSDVGDIQKERLVVVSVFLETIDRMIGRGIGDIPVRIVGRIGLHNLIVDAKRPHFPEVPRRNGFPWSLVSGVEEVVWYHRLDWRLLATGQSSEAAVELQKSVVKFRDLPGHSR